MRVWVDMNTPKQVLFLGRLADELEGRGFEVLRTARGFREVKQLLRLEGIEAIVVGGYGGPTLEGKLKASLWRASRLARIVDEWRPRVAISFSSPEAARVAFGLGIPHLCVNDSPHSEAVARLTIPLSHTLYTPACIPKEAWTRYGIEEDRVVQYRAVDPVAWLRRMRLARRARRRPLVVARVEEEQASYYPGGARVAEAVRRVAGRVDVDVVVLPRYHGQVSRLREELRGVARVPGRVVDARRLLSEAHLFIGGGGTMTWEAALMGVPSISMTPIKGLYVEDYMVRLGLVRRAESVEEAVELAISILSRVEEEVERQGRLAARVMGEMEDPVEVIARGVESLAR